MFYTKCPKCDEYYVVDKKRIAYCPFCDESQRKPKPITQKELHYLYLYS